MRNLYVGFVLENKSGVPKAVSIAPTMARAAALAQQWLEEWDKPTEEIPSQFRLGWVQSIAVYIELDSSCLKEETQT